MRVILPTILTLITMGSEIARAGTLESAYDAATTGGGYDKYVVLETGVTYTGGLWIGGTFNRITAEFEAGGKNTKIVGNGAILDLQGGEITIAYCTKRLDIENCVIINGNVRFRGYNDDTISLLPAGSVSYVTLYRPHDYGVRLYHCGPGIRLERNIVVDAIDTGSDFQYLTGLPMTWLAGGAAFSSSLIGGGELYHNWTFHSDPAANTDPLRHFTILCDYG